MYRSAGAESILRKKLADAGIDDWIVDSAGTSLCSGLQDGGHVFCLGRVVYHPFSRLKVLDYRICLLLSFLLVIVGN